MSKETQSHLNSDRERIISELSSLKEEKLRDKLNSDFLGNIHAQQGMLKEDVGFIEYLFKAMDACGPKSGLRWEALKRIASTALDLIAEKTAEPGIAIGHQTTLAVGIAQMTDLMRQQQVETKSSTVNPMGKITPRQTRTIAEEMTAKELEDLTNLILKAAALREKVERRAQEEIRSQIGAKDTTLPSPALYNGKPASRSRG